MAKLYLTEYIDKYDRYTKDKEFQKGFLEVLGNKQTALYDNTGLLVENSPASFTDMQNGRELGEYHDGDSLMRDALIINYVMRPKTIPFTDCGVDP